MKFDPIVEYNMRKVLLKNHTQNVVEKLFPHPFFKKIKIEYFSGSLV